MSHAAHVLHERSTAERFLIAGTVVGHPKGDVLSNCLPHNEGRLAHKGAAPRTCHFTSRVLTCAREHSEESALASADRATNDEKLARR
eukprot:CAMPEP_0174723724 /NCGR_PEP_ID=MMETSP1094-20130205/41690_1 /TAXON_ID=156173 /ORGANISM="Chrysochromulina brevifilum, Strain UTEX LB 985" /LENGTH=87 /DNA_ID=CAMNT_0015924813 /DNA_START=27 /DNA_END=286 /DNA_ORIENTATION=+